MNAVTEVIVAFCSKTNSVIPLHLQALMAVMEAQA